MTHLAAVTQVYQSPSFRELYLLRQLVKGYHAGYEIRRLQGLIPPGSALRDSIPEMARVGYGIYSVLKTEPSFDAADVHPEMKSFFKRLLLEKDQEQRFKDLIAMTQWVAYPHEYHDEALEHDMKNLRWSFYSFLNHEKIVADIPFVYITLHAVKIEITDQQKVIFERNFEYLDFPKHMKSHRCVREVMQVVLQSLSKKVRETAGVSNTNVESALGFLDGLKEDVSVSDSAPSSGLQLFRRAL